MNDQLTTRLSRQLHEQVDDMRDAPLTLDGVRGRAHSIRRRRHAVGAGVVAAAVLAVAIPVGLSLGAQTDSSPGPATPSRSEIVDTENPQPVQSAIDLPYLEGTLLTLPDGTELELPPAGREKTYVGGAVLGDHALVLRFNGSNGEYLLDRLDSDGEVTESVPVDGGIARNPEGSAIAYATGGELVIEWSNGQTNLGPIGRPDLVRLLGGPDCTLGADDCVVYFHDGRTPRFRNNSGEEAEVSGDLLKVLDVTYDDRIAVLTRIYERPEPGSCSEVRDVQTQDVVFETCQHTLGRFSPDGAHISGLPSYLDGIGSGYAAILDAETGDELVRFEPEDGFVRNAIWEDDSHLLVTAYDAGAWSVTRLGLDGSVELALGPSTATDEMTPAYTVLGTG